MEALDLDKLLDEMFPFPYHSTNSLNQYHWRFSNLEKAFEEGGELYGRQVYLFGLFESHVILFRSQEKMTHIPIVVAVVSSIPPSDKIAIISDQRETEEILPMTQVELDWVPFPLRKGTPQSQLFIMSPTLERVDSKSESEAFEKYEQCLPFFYNPLSEYALERNTSVQIQFPAEPIEETLSPAEINWVRCSFDWAFDELEEFTNNLIKEKALSENQKEAFKGFVAKEVTGAKIADREAREAKEKALKDMSEDVKDAFRNMKLYKFYPVPSIRAPDLTSVMNSFINKYYGDADEVR